MDALKRDRQAYQTHQTRLRLKRRTASHPPKATTDDTNFDSNVLNVLSLDFVMGGRGRSSCRVVCFRDPQAR